MKGSVVALRKGASEIPGESPYLQREPVSHKVVFCSVLAERLRGRKRSGEARLTITGVSAYPSKKGESNAQEISRPGRPVLTERKTEGDKTVRKKKSFKYLLLIF